MFLGYLKSADKFISCTTLLKSARHRKQTFPVEKKEMIIFTSNRHILFTGHALSMNMPVYGTKDSIKRN